MNIYTHPEHHGLTPFGEIDWKPHDYGFDITAVWTAKNGTIYWADDTGCSCPTPFEDQTVHDTTYGTRGKLLRHIEQRRQEQEIDYNDRYERDEDDEPYTPPAQYSRLVERITNELPHNPRAEIRQTVLDKASEPAEHEPPKLHTYTTTVGWTDTPTIDGWTEPQYPIPVELLTQTDHRVIVGGCDNIFVDGKRIRAEIYIPKEIIEQIEYRYLMGLMDYRMREFVGAYAKSIILLPPERVE